jgi:NAD(P)-dependent dehydrogenase (short-subunit alcohol dehydrogenase family)
MSGTDRPQSGALWLITGCSSGLGVVIARAAAARGAHVVATARNASAIPDLPDLPEDRVTRMALDVTDGAQRADVVHEVIERFGSVDVLVNNAGRVYLGAVEECTDSDLREMFDLHVFGPTDLARLVLPGMRARRRGTIVQMSTMGAFLITPGFSAYTATKAALEGVSATLAAEVAPFGIRVLIVEPGSHRTSVFAPGRLSVAPRMPAYADSVGAVEQFLRDRNGNQAGDPERAAEIIVDMVDAQRAPLRLALGADAVDNIRAAIRAIETDIVEWAELARSTGYHAQDDGREGGRQ